MNKDGLTSKLGDGKAEGLTQNEGSNELHQGIQAILVFWRESGRESCFCEVREIETEKVMGRIELTDLELYQE